MHKVVIRQRYEFGKWDESDSEIHMATNKPIQKKRWVGANKDGMDELLVGL